MPSFYRTYLYVAVKCWNFILAIFYSIIKLCNKQENFRNEINMYINLNIWENTTKLKMTIFNFYFN